MEKSDNSSPNQVASTSTKKSEKVEIVLITTPSTPSIKRCRPMTDEIFLRAPPKKVRIFVFNSTVFQ